jgi:outer membrane protein insertion porin family
MSCKFSYIFVVLAVICFYVPLGAQENLKIKGLNFFKNMNYKGRLAFLHGVPVDEPAVLDAAFLEDSAYLLLQQLKRNGYLKPGVEGVFRVGDVSRYAVWENEYSIQLAADFFADYATFYLRPGVLYYYESVEVKGVTVLDEETIRL